MDEYQNKLWVLILVNSYSKKGGLDVNEACRKAGRLINVVEIVSCLGDLKKDKYIKFNSKGFTYSIEEKGSKYLSKELKKFKEKDYLDFLNILPVEIAHNYRLHSIENTIFWGAFGWASFNAALMLLRFGYTLTSLILLPFSMVCIGLSIGFFVRIISLSIYRFFNKLEKFLEEFKVFDWRVWNITKK